MKIESAAAPRPGDVDVVILTFNEAVHIARAIGSVRGFAGQVFVIDSHSTDATVEIARAAGAIVIQHPFVNYAQQFQWALDNAPITAAWTMRLDADEVVEPALAEEIAARLPTLPPDVTAINLRLKRIFMGRWIRWGGRSHYLLRLWRTGAARIECRWMDEHMLIERGRTVNFVHSFADHNLKDLGFFTAKHNGYATREAVDLLNRRYGLFDQETIADRGASTASAFVKRLIKERIYNKIPFYVAAPGYFLFRYVLQLGFLDGVPGLIYHFLQGCWYRFLVGAKVAEFEQTLKPLDGKQAKLDALSAMTGHQLGRVTADATAEPA